MNRSVKNPFYPWPLICLLLVLASSVVAQTTQVKLKLADGSYITVDEAWESPQGVWYRLGGLSHLLAKEKVKKIERSTPAPAPAAATAQNSNDDDHFEVSEVVARTPSTNGVYDQPAWIYLKGGARVEADSASQSAAGVWYKRGSMSIFIDASRVDRIEVEDPAVVAQTGKKASGWSTGRPGLDSLIRQNGNKYGVDPYLIFLVMEQESHFNTHAVSPKGARGLLQLMPGTAARFGVRRAHDPAQNISGGTRYLRELLNRFNNRVDLVLASYNAGEGAVAKFGNRVPPYKETRNYVKKISYRYKRTIARTKKPAPGTAAKDSGER
ncbi:MAG TPA: lytic transglycosylase domain-containing protein [Pyrinomonadaceae bacterium]|jgi:soluble lytic murein transglycosylase-like protein|nr:lytic transglycosylase domain-containing protein [Pyrinomonadaceae bacterium]